MHSSKGVISNEHLLGKKYQVFFQRIEESIAKYALMLYPKILDSKETDMKEQESSAKIPLLIYGSAWKKEQTAGLVERAVLAGFRGIDTACQPKHYNEEGVGEALRVLEKRGIPRSALFLQTKFTPLPGHDPLRLPYDPNADISAQVHQSFQVSQRNLGTDYVDSLVLHSPYSRFEDLLAAWKALEEIHRAGGARRLGISNCYDLQLFKRFFEAVEIKPAILQNRFYRETGYDKELRAWSRERSVIYQSFWTLTANPHILQNPVLKDMARDYQRTDAQIFFRYLTQIGLVPLTGTTSEIHMKEDLDIAGFELKASDLENLGRLLE